jgi:hypothetical protein
VLAIQLTHYKSDNVFCLIDFLQGQHLCASLAMKDDGLCQAFEERMHIH